MRVVSVTLRDFRCYEQAQVALGEGLTVVSGPNGAGKTNLLEAIYFGSVGRSCRTSNERELIRFGAPATRVVVDTREGDCPHRIEVGFAPGEAKRLRVDGAGVERLLDSPARPLLSVFLPDRLELIKGPPALRRAHLDRLVAALWPSRALTRRAYAHTLAQRNALIARIRTGSGSRDSLAAWDLQLARHGVALMGDRAAAVEAVCEPFERLAGELGLDGGMSLEYRPRSHAGGPDQLAAELADRAERDLERGFTGHGPHRDELALLRAGRELRTYGSQGQQRLGLLALLLAERAAISGVRGEVPLLLLDDVMSELDGARRASLMDRLRAGGGQCVITTTDLAQVPGALGPGVARVAVAGGTALQEAVAA